MTIKKTISTLTLNSEVLLIPPSVKEETIKCLLQSRDGDIIHLALYSTEWRNRLGEVVAIQPDHIESIEVNRGALPTRIYLKYDLILLRRDTVSFNSVIREKRISELVTGLLPEYFYVTGRQPYEEGDLIVFFKKLGCTCLHDYDYPSDETFVIIGRYDFNKEKLKRLLTRKRIRFFSQEDFFMYLFWKHKNYSADDPRIIEHRGLRFLRCIRYEWPDLYEEGIGNESSIDFTNLHPLNTEFGYHAHKTISTEARRESLQRAIMPPEQGLGLREVAYHLRDLININANNQIMSSARIKWKDDLEYLFQEYYLGKGLDFAWPEINWRE